MQQPSLIIIAGCNGSGKSTYSQSLVGNRVIPFDYDKKFLHYYNGLLDSEYREQFAIDKATSDLELLVSESFRQKQSFCFETNLVTVPINWINQAKELGYCIEIYFFCLETIEKAKDRVLLRAKNEGHFVEDGIISYKWKEGYKNLNNHFFLADRLYILDNSVDSEIPRILIELEKISDERFDFLVIAKVPEYIQRRLPSIYDLLNS